MNMTFPEFYESLIRNTLEETRKEWEAERESMSVKDMEDEFAAMDLTEYNGPQVKVA